MEVLEVWQNTCQPFDEEGNKVSQKEIPHELSLHPRLPARSVLSWHPTKEVATLHYPYLMDVNEPDKTTIVVALLGVSHKRGGIRPPRAPWAVSFGNESPHNFAALLNPSYPQTEFYAKVEALSQAMDIIARDFTNNGEKLEFFILTDLCINPKLSEGCKDWIMRITPRDKNGDIDALPNRISGGIVLYFSYRHLIELHQILTFYSIDSSIPCGTSFDSNN
ncbi:hypothetical protein F5B19DRAFT_496171 [Rostrohypoxylon terebratum]|nr:hypothetical protein F5B19DRAFT_496171 [Rostrohypoxylon terebratum]